jgi:hypothetical protein
MLGLFFLFFCFFVFLSSPSSELTEFLSARYIGCRGGDRGPRSRVYVILVGGKQSGWCQDPGISGTVGGSLSLYTEAERAMVQDFRLPEPLVGLRVSCPKIWAENRKDFFWPSTKGRDPPRPTPPLSPTPTPSPTPFPLRTHSNRRVRANRPGVVP